MSEQIIADGPAVELVAKGIQCDAAGCDFHDAGAPHKGESYADYLNRPCPKCGASLLTQADCDLMQTLERAAKFANLLATALGIEPSADAPQHPRIKLQMRGDGSLTIQPPVQP